MSFSSELPDERADGGPGRGQHHIDESDLRSTLDEALREAEAQAVQSGAPALDSSSGGASGPGDVPGTAAGAQLWSVATRDDTAPRTPVPQAAAAAGAPGTGDPRMAAPGGRVLRLPFVQAGSDPDPRTPSSAITAGSPSPAAAGAAGTDPEADAVTDDEHREGAGSSTTRHAGWEPIANARPVTLPPNPFGPRPVRPGSGLPLAQMAGLVALPATPTPPPQTGAAPTSEHTRPARPLPGATISALVGRTPEASGADTGAESDVAPATAGDADPVADTTAVLAALPDLSDTRPINLPEPAPAAHFGREPAGGRGEPADTRAWVPADDDLLPNRKPKKAQLGTGPRVTLDWPTDAGPARRSGGASGSRVGLRPSTPATIALRGAARGDDATPSGSRLGRLASLSKRQVGGSRRPSPPRQSADPGSGRRAPGGQPGGKVPFLSVPPYLKRLRPGR